MPWPWVSRRKHEAELRTQLQAQENALRQKWRKEKHRLCGPIREAAGKLLEAAAVMRLDRVRASGEYGLFVRLDPRMVIPMSNWARHDDLILDAVVYEMTAKLRDLLHGVNAYRPDEHIAPIPGYRGYETLPVGIWPRPGRD
jgi:hypothetical protein